MDKESYIKKYAKETKKPVEELEELYTQTEQRMAKLGITEERAIQLAFRRKLRGAVFGKGRKGRTPVEFFGFVYGTSRLIDWDEMRRNKALKAYNENRDDAVLQGIVDESGNPLDDKAEIYVFGQKKANPNFRKPLVGHSYDRKVFGMVTMEGDDEPKVFRLNLKGKTAKEFKGWKPFVPVRFLALSYSENGDPFYELYPCKLTKFQSDPKAKIEIEQWIRTAGHVYKLDKIDQAYNASKDAKDNWVFIEADLDYINPTVDEDRQQRSLNIADDAVGLQTFRVRIPMDVPISFSEFSRVIVMGEIQKWLRQDKSEAVTIEGYGVFAIPGQEVKMPEKDAYPATDQGTQEEPIILWE